MRPEERDPAHLWDMLEAARAVVDLTQNLTLKEFLTAGRDKEITRLAVERKLEILGEAARRVSSAFRDLHPVGIMNASIVVLRKFDCLISNARFVEKTCNSWLPIFSNQGVGLLCF